MSGDPGGQSNRQLRFIETMADVTITRGVPEYIISGNGSEMTAKVVRKWFCKARSEDAVHRAWQSVGERILRVSFNGKLRDECLTAESLKEAIVVIEQWHIRARNPPNGVGGSRRNSLYPAGRKYSSDHDCNGLLNGSAGRKIMGRGRHPAGNFRRLLGAE